MRQVLRCLSLIALLVGAVVGVSNGSTVPTISPETTSLITFSFTATVNKITGRPPFTVAIGDKFTGTFSYSPTTPDSNIHDPNQGYYHPPAPAKVQFQLNSLVFSCDNSNCPAYRPVYNVLVQNDDASALPVRDKFEWSADDLVASDQLDVDRVSAIFSLQDLTANIFTDDSLPQSLNIQDFATRYLDITTIERGMGSSTIRLQIDEITKM